jgi:curved DNA-binding protein CbpA
VRYDSRRLEIFVMTNAGKLENNPLAELIREIGAKGLSGAVRLSQNQAKAVIYCENGGIIFAASNLRAHRLSDFLRRNQLLNDEQMAALSPKTTDDELFGLLAQNARMIPEALKTIRANHISDMLRAMLLWTTGEWQFESRVRIAGDTRVTIDVKRLLLECARHLPASYLAARFNDQTETLELAKNNGHQAKLIPAEAFIMSRVAAPITLKDLLTISGMNEVDTLRAVYGLSLAGLLLRREWPIELAAHGQKSTPPPAAVPDEQSDLKALFARLDKAGNHYDVLDVGRNASPDEVRDAYHALARKYHPDRYHQRDLEARRQIESAFARIARAYETLGESSARDAYDAQLADIPAPVPAPVPSPSGKQAQSDVVPKKDPNSERAEASFKNGLAAAKNNQPEHAVRFFAEAASLNPRMARYRAEYGRALTAQSQTRRIAEIELQAAIALEPNNGDYRLMLAELYKVLGLRRRAAGEIQKALAADPKNEAARTLLSSLKK